MTTFDNIYELLESVRIYELPPKETLIQVTAPDGKTFGYYTADGPQPAESWVIDLKVAKSTALARGTKEALHIRDLLSSFMGRRDLLLELRQGTLEYGIAALPGALTEVSEGPPDLSVDLESTGFEGLRQCLIPGL